ncbi:MAG: ATP-binding cassette domain-containing protein [Acidobacteriota bacterium]
MIPARTGAVADTARAGGGQPGTQTVPVILENVTHTFGTRRVLDGLSFQIGPGEFFGLLGPNGSGKTTLFRILATLLFPTSGRVRVFGFNVALYPGQVRSRIGVVFQTPALDDQLTVRENLRHHARYHGLAGPALARRLEEVLDALGIKDRSAERVGILSGGLQRRVDLARGLMHRPDLLILDEPSTGLDPGARRDFWSELDRLRAQTGLTILLTTHLMAEGERCDRVGILDRGQMVALGDPTSLCQEVGGTVLTLKTDQPGELVQGLQDRFDLAARVVDGALRLEHDDGHALVPRLVTAFPGRITSVTVQAPTLEDVFIKRTGHQFQDEEPLRNLS